MKSILIDGVRYKRPARSITINGECFVDVGSLRGQDRADQWKSVVAKANASLTKRAAALRSEVAAFDSIKANAEKVEREVRARDNTIAKIELLLGPDNDNPILQRNYLNQIREIITAWRKSRQA